MAPPVKPLWVNNSVRVGRILSSVTTEMRRPSVSPPVEVCHNVAYITHCLRNEASITGIIITEIQKGNRPFFLRFQHFVQALCCHKTTILQVLTFMDKIKKNESIHISLANTFNTTLPALIKSRCKYYLKPDLKNLFEETGLLSYRIRKHLNGIINSNHISEETKKTKKRRDFHNHLTRK